MGKHAYLIIAHNNWSQLSFLIEILNDPLNDFFVLIDSKALDFDKNFFLSTLKHKNIHLTPQIDIRWGDYSQIKAELIMLKCATTLNHYDYYHLISGVDMPLKPQSEIHSFFDLNYGAEFVDFDDYNNNSFALKRARYHYFFQPIIGRKKVTVLKIIRDCLVLFESIINVNRTKKIAQDLGKGSNWFSITDNFARYIVENEDFIQKQFKNTYCCDEVFLQTMLKHSPYRDNWYGFRNPSVQYQNLRFCDWGRGKPYTFRKDEYFSLTNSEYLFARKFSNDIISEDIKSYLLND